AVKIDLDGLADRYVQFPVPPGDYNDLAATARNVYYLSTPVKGLAEDDGDGEPSRQLIAFNLHKRKAKPFMEGVTSFKVAGKADKLAIQKKKHEIFVVEAGAKAPPGEELGDAKVSFDGMIVELVPQDEWKQIYFEAWRLMRDFYWDPNMGGVDWKAER